MSIESTSPKIIQYIMIVVSWVDGVLALSCLIGALFSVVNNTTTDTNYKRLVIAVLSFIPSYTLAPSVALHFDISDLTYVVGFVSALLLHAVSKKLTSLVSNWNFGDRI